MNKLNLQKNALGFEVWDGTRLITIYRAKEELPRAESPKPCFAPIYTPGGGLVTEYRPADHPWHTGLYFGWVFANKVNLWGGPWYIPSKNRYEFVEGTHGVQQHDAFTRLENSDAGIVTVENLSWIDADERIMAREVRTYEIETLADFPGYRWNIHTRISAEGNPLELASSRKSHYSGLELRMGPPFSDANHRNSEGLSGHENIMGQRARWVSAIGGAGGEVIMMDHPDNPRYPVTWFVRRNLMGAGLLMEEDLVIETGQVLDLRYGFIVLDQPLSNNDIEKIYDHFSN